MTEAKRTRLSAALRQWPLMALAAMLILTALLRVLPAWSQVFPGKGETARASGDDFETYGACPYFFLLFH